MLVTPETFEFKECAAEVARILHEDIKTVRAEQRELVLASVQVRARALYARMAGARRADLRFDSETFGPSGLGLEGWGIIDIASTLSGGKEEQLQMVAHFALVDDLASRKPQLVVLDDPLSLTDAVRFALPRDGRGVLKSNRTQFLNHYVPIKRATLRYEKRRAMTYAGSVSPSDLRRRLRNHAWETCSDTFSGWC